MSSGSRVSLEGEDPAGEPQGGISPPEALTFLGRSRVARLATADANGAPHVIPVCFAVSPGGGRIYIALDEKPKTVDVRKLKRVRNILENPQVALTADRYSEDWQHLAFAMIRGDAELLEPRTDEHPAAIRLLRGKYHQYETMKIEDNAIIAITPRKTAFWSGENPELSGDDTEGNHESGGEIPLRDAMLGRRSVRRYLDLAVPEEKLERILDAARFAPSPHGTQPFRLAVIESETTKFRLADAMGEAWVRNLEMDSQPEAVVTKRLDGSRKRLMDAPVLILVCLYAGDLDRYPDAKRQRDEETMAVQALGAATQNMLLAAYAEGLDTGWMCAPLFTPETVVKALGLDENLVPHALITLGYADGDPPKRRPRRPLQEVIAYRD